MGKTKPPADGPAAYPGMTPAASGAAAYRKMMGKDPPLAGKRKLPEKTGAGENGGNPAGYPPPEDGFLKTGSPPPSGKNGKKPPVKKGKNAGEPGASKFRRAAQFMVLIGSAEASKILSRLDPGQVEAISKEIVSTGSISPEEAGAVLEEFRSLLSPSFGYSGASSGGIEEARRHLYAAFGPERGEALLLKAVPDAAENPFGFLKDFTGEQLALLFRDESPAACALVFSRLPPELSAAALAATSPGRKLETVRRIARLKETSPEVIGRVASALREKARHFGRTGEGAVVDGKNVLAAILKHSDLAFGDRLLGELEEADPSLGREMQDRLYTLDDVPYAADRPIQEKLRTMSDREIALLLQGRSGAFTGKILGNLSSARAGRIKEESEIMGPVPEIERGAAAREFLAWFRLNREEGRILMLNSEDVLL